MFSRDCFMTDDSQWRMVVRESGIRFHDETLWWWNDASRWRWAHSSTTKTEAMHGTSRHDPIASSFSSSKRIRPSALYTWVTFSLVCLAFHGRLDAVSLTWRLVFISKNNNKGKKKKTKTMGVMKQKKPIVLFFWYRRDLGRMTWSFWRDWMDGSHEQAEQSWK